jgi:hypothetical protein
MTFRFTIEGGTATLTAEPVTLHAGSPTADHALALRITKSITLYVPLDRIEELVAGIQDEARQAAGQQPAAGRTLTVQEHKASEAEAR